MPHFFVDDNFYDSKEVLAIPARHRLAAMGLWTAAGAWSMNKLTDGFVPNEALKMLGARPALIAALADSTDLWERVSGGIQFTNWAKWQRTREQVESYRAYEAERKRTQREKMKTAANSKNANLSHQDTHRDNNSCPGGTPATPVPVPVPKYLTGSLSGSSQVSKTPPAPPPDTAIEPIAATDGGTLVRSVIPSEHPAATQTALRLRANELLHAGTPESDVREALTLWLTKPHLGPNALSALVSEVIKSRDQPKPSSKLRATAELAQRMRDEENQAQRKELA